MLRRLMFGVAIALSLAVSTPSNATTALALNIDGSGSISAADFALQKQGYINALNDLYTNNPNLYGQNAIGIWQFASNVVNELGLTQIDNAADLAIVTGALNAMVQLGTNTAIGQPIVDATAALVARDVDPQDPVHHVHRPSVRRLPHHPDR